MKVPTNLSDKALLDFINYNEEELFSTPPKIQEDIIERCCNNISIREDTDMGVFVCISCGRVLTDCSLVDTYYDEIFHSKRYYAYQQRLYFNDWIKYITGKKTMTYDSAIINKIAHIITPSTPYSQYIKLLQSHKLTLFYKSLPFILKLKHNIEPPVLHYSEVETLQRYFKQLSKAVKEYKRHHPEIISKCMFSYTFTINMFLKVMNKPVNSPLLHKRSKRNSKAKLWFAVSNNNSIFN